jgi:hypothetical protein
LFCFVAFFLLSCFFCMLSSFAVLTWVYLYHQAGEGTQDFASHSRNGYRCRTRHQGETSARLISVSGFCSHAPVGRLIVMKECQTAHSAVATAGALLDANAMKFSQREVQPMRSPSLKYRITPDNLDNPSRRRVARSI